MTDAPKPDANETPEDSPASQALPGVPGNTGSLGAAQRPCPICKGAVKNDLSFVPFCSKRCKMVDLNQWFTGAYTISRPAELDDWLETDIPRAEEGEAGNEPGRG